MISYEEGWVVCGAGGFEFQWAPVADTFTPGCSPCYMDMSPGWPIGIDGLEFA